MATTTVTELVTRTITATSGTASSTLRAAPQGGILEGGNPSHYDPKNPIILFIIQVSNVKTLNGSASHKLKFHMAGFHYPDLLPTLALSFVSASPTAGHCRSHSWYFAGSVCDGSNTGLQQCHLPHRLITRSHFGSELGPGTVLVPRGSRGRLEVPYQ